MKVYPDDYRSHTVQKSVKFPKSLYKCMRANAPSARMLHFFAIPDIKDAVSVI